MHLIEALGTSVNRCLGQTDEKWHEDQGQEAKDHHRNHGKKVAEQAWLVLDDRVRDGIAIRALYLG